LTGEIHGPLPPGVGTGRFLVIDPKNANTLYASYLNAGEKWHEGGRESWSYLGIKKFAIMGRMVINPPNMWQKGNSSILPAGRYWPLQLIRMNAAVKPSGTFYPLSLSSNGKSIGITDGHQLDLLSTADLKTRTGTIACSGAADLAFHPVLEMAAVEGDNGDGGQSKRTALYIFNTKSLTQVNRFPLGAGPIAKSPPAGRLLTFGARGTTLLYYDWLQGGYLRSFPVTLTPDDKKALAKVYGNQQ